MEKNAYLCIHDHGKRKEPRGKTAIIAGNELFGVDDNVLPHCDGAIEIPQRGTKHSFNVSIATGIVIWHIFNILQKY